jgi:hypothetical protein
VDDYDLIINRALLMVAAAAHAAKPQRERALRNAKAMIDSAAKRRYTGIANEAHPPPAKTPTGGTQAGEPPPKPNRAASSRPPAIMLTRRAKRNESR